MKHNRGFSLAEIMVSVGLLGVISLGVMQVMKESSKLKKTSSQNVNVDAVVTKIQNLIRNPDVCKSTLFNLDPTDTSATGTNGFISKVVSYPNIANVQVYKGSDPLNIDANDINDFSGQSGGTTYFQSGCNPMGTLTQITPCTSGPAKDRILLKNLKIMAFELDSGFYSNKPGSGRATIEMTLLRTQGISKPTITEAEKSQTFGAVEFKKRINVNVKIDANKKIFDCVSELTSFDQGTCDQIEGKIASDYKCKNVKIKTNSLNPPHPNSITSSYDLRVQGASTNIIDGMMDIGPSPTGDTSILAGVRTTGEVSITDNLNIAQGLLYFGPYNTETLRGEFSSPGVLKISEKGNLSRGQLHLGNSLQMFGNTGNLGINKPSPTYTLDVLGSGYVSTTMTGNSNFYANNDFWIKAAKFSIAGAVMTMSGVNVETIGTQNNISVSDFEHGDGDWVATRDWLYQMFNRRLGDVDSINAISDAIQSYAGTTGTQLDKLLHGICAGMNNFSYGAQCVLNAGNNTPIPNYVNALNASGLIASKTFLNAGFNCPSYYVVTGINTAGNIVCSDVDPIVINDVKDQIRTKLLGMGFTTVY